MPPASVGADVDPREVAIVVRSTADTASVAAAIRRVARDVIPDVPVESLESCDRAIQRRAGANQVAIGMLIAFSERRFSSVRRVSTARWRCPPISARQSLRRDSPLALGTRCHRPGAGPGGESARHRGGSRAPGGCRGGVRSASGAVWRHAARSMEPHWCRRAPDNRWRRGECRTRRACVQDRCNRVHSVAIGKCPDRTPRRCLASPCASTRSALRSLVDA